MVARVKRTEMWREKMIENEGSLVKRVMKFAGKRPRHAWLYNK